MNPPILKSSGHLAVLATVLFMPALTRAATVIGSLPYTISAPGVYELKSNLTANGTIGITVQAANVVINLNGFTLAQGQTGPENQKDSIDISADNVTIRNATISDFQSGVSVTGSQCKAQDLKLLGNAANGVLLFSGNDNTVVNCFIIGRNGVPDNLGIFVRSGSGDLVKDNQISETSGGIDSTFASGCAFVHNYVANSFRGLDRSTSDYYQGNVVTGCHFAFTGGNVIGAENGGN